MITEIINNLHCIFIIYIWLVNNIIVLTEISEIELKSCFFFFVWRISFKLILSTQITDARKSLNVKNEKVSARVVVQTLKPIPSKSTPSAAGTWIWEFAPLSNLTAISTDPSAVTPIGIGLTKFFHNLHFVPVVFK